MFFSLQVSKLKSFISICMGIKSVHFHSYLWLAEPVLFSFFCQAKIRHPCIIQAFVIERYTPS